MAKNIEELLKRRKEIMRVLAANNTTGKDRKSRSTLNRELRELNQQLKKQGYGPNSQLTRTQAKKQSTRIEREKEQRRASVDPRWKKEWRHIWRG